MDDRKFWALYLLVMFLFFSFVTAGLLFAYIKNNADPVAGALMSNGDSFYLMNHGNNSYTVYYNGQHATFVSQIPFNTPIGQCTEITLTINFSKRMAEINETIADPYLCE